MDSQKYLIQFSSIDLCILLFLCIVMLQVPAIAITEAETDYEIKSFLEELGNGPPGDNNPATEKIIAIEKVLCCFISLIFSFNAYNCLKYLIVPKYK